MRRETALLTLLATLSAAQNRPTLSVSNTNQLQSAAASALANLLSFYQPNDQGVFDQVQTPWHSSSMMWAAFMDYQKYSGDNQFASLVTGALVNISYGTQQDILGGALRTTNEKILGKWNDDILWPAMAINGGGELYGGSAIMPGADGAWDVTPQRTLEQTWEYEDNLCGGGIYWSRNPESGGGNYKSLITNVEYIACAARTHLQNQNDTIITQARTLWAWMQSSGLYASDGTLYDGFNADDCGNLVNAGFSYNYGQAIGAATWMHYVTKEQTWLDQAATIFQRSLGLFFTTDSVMEQCEASGVCGRDAQDFKAIYLRNLAYLFRETQDQSVKDSIGRVIDTSVNSMVSRSCTADWFCNGNWSAGSQPIRYVRSQHASAALLVSALGIHSTATGSGLITNVNQAELNVTGSGSAGLGGYNQGSIDSKPLDAAPSLRGAALPLVVAICAVVMALGVLL